MYIKEITLSNYKRFLLNSIKKYKLNLDNNLTIFNWGNGSGKSSLLGELNPLPSDIKKDFLPDGFKEIKITHLGKEYVIRSDSKGHSILEDGVELNTGGTKRAQLELIESLFNITPHSINVINGSVLFTNMSPNDRKQWFNKISTIDYKYPIGVFTKMLERKKDLVSFIKLTNEKIANINNLLKEIMDVEECVKNREHMAKLVEDLLKHYNKDIPELNKDLEEELLRINASISNWLDSNNDIIDYDTICKQINMLELYIKSNTEKIDKLHKDIDKLSKEQDAETISSYEIKLKELEKEIIKTYGVLDIVNEYDIVYDRFTEFYNKLNIVYEKIDNLVKNRKYDISKLPQELESLKKKYELAKEKYNKHLGREDNYNRIKKINSLICTNCNTPIDADMFKPKEGVKEELEKEIEEIGSELDKIIIGMKDEENIEKMTIAINSSIDGNLLLSKYIDMEQVKDVDIVTKSKYILNKLNMFLATFSNKLFTDYKDIKSSIEKNTNSISKQVIKEKIEDMTKEFDKIKSETHEARLKLDKLNKEKDSLERLKKHRDTLLDLFKKEKKNKDITFKILENEYIEYAVEMLKKEISILDSIIENHKTLTTRLEEHRKESSSYNKELEVLNELLDILSPSNGLIAKSVNSFIGVILKEMNSIINAVWNYNMEILPCVLEDKDLDYKFRVLVNDDYIVEDISKLSSSMQEIINLAFRLVFIKYSKLNGIPLVLDEFGRTMDREHRINAFNLIDTILSSNFEQIFLVSHFEEMYGRFKNAVFPVLNNC